MIEKSYADYSWEKAAQLLAIDSPSGYTAKAAQWVKDTFEQLGLCGYVGRYGGSGEGQRPAEVDLFGRYAPGKR